MIVFQLLGATRKEIKRFGEAVASTITNPNGYIVTPNRLSIYKIEPTPDSSEPNKIGFKVTTIKPESNSKP